MLCAFQGDDSKMLVSFYVLYIYILFHFYFILLLLSLFLEPHVLTVMKITWGVIWNIWWKI